MLREREAASVRILQIAPPWFTVPPTGYGGTEQVVSLLTEGLIDRGHDVVLLASGGSRTRGQLWSPYEQPPTARLGDGTVELPHVLAGYRRRDEFDVIHDHTAIGAAIASVTDGPPVVHTVHGPWTPAATALYGDVGDDVHLVAISQDHAGRRPPGVELAAVIHNGIDVGRYPFVDVKGDHLAFVGRASHEKGPELAIEVARRLGRRLLMAIKVNEPEEHEYFEAVVAPRLHDADVEVVEPGRWCAAETMGSAAAVLFPIQWPEPFGLVPLEANACGTPVVAFAHGAVPEVVADGVSGFVVAPGDLDAFCAAVERCGELDPATCRRHAAERFSDERAITAYETLYERVVRSGSGRERRRSRRPHRVPRRRNAPRLAAS